MARPWKRRCESTSVVTHGTRFSTQARHSTQTTVQDLPKRSKVRALTVCATALEEHRLALRGTHDEALASTPSHVCGVGATDAHGRTHVLVRADMTALAGTAEGYYTGEGHYAAGPPAAVAGPGPYGGMPVPSASPDAFEPHYHQKPQQQHQQHPGPAHYQPPPPAPPAAYYQQAFPPSVAHPFPDPYAQAPPANEVMPLPGYSVLETQELYSVLYAVMAGATQETIAVSRAAGPRSSAGRD